MPTPQAHYAQILAHYARLAAHPGWKQYAWQRVQQMARECPELYGTLPQELTLAVRNAHGEKSPGAGAVAVDKR